MNRFFAFLLIPLLSFTVIGDEIDDYLDSFDVLVPEVIVANVNAVEINVAEVYVAEVYSPVINAAQIEEAEVVVEEVSAPSVNCVDIEEELAFVSSLPSFMTTSGKTFYVSNHQEYYVMLKRWGVILKDHAEDEFERGSAISRSRIISEARISSKWNRAILEENLEFYKKSGYNGVLLTFDDNSNIIDGLDIIECIEGFGMKIWLGYAGSHNPYNPLMDDLKYASMLRAFARHCEAFLISWRDTSVHWAKMPSGFMNYSADVVRSVNPSIALIGEAYRGKSAENLYAADINKTVVSGMSGILAINFDKSNISRKHAMNYLKKDNMNFQIVALVCGDPGYFSKYNMSYEENFMMKKKLENEFLMNGCSAVITMPCDGTDNGYGRGMEDISVSSYKSMSSK